MTDFEALKAEAAALTEDARNLKLTTESLPEAKALMLRVEQLLDKAKTAGSARQVQKLQEEVGPTLAGVRTFLENWNQLVPFWTRFAEIHAEMQALAQGPPRYEAGRALIGEAVTLIRQYQPLLPDPGGMDERIAQLTRMAASLQPPDAEAAAGLGAGPSEAADEARS